MVTAINITSSASTMPYLTPLLKVLCISLDEYREGALMESRLHTENCSAISTRSR